MVQQLKAVNITADNFKRFGQIIAPIEDGVPFDPNAEASLHLDKGTPRLYIMSLPKRGRTFSKITYHGQVSQCLGALAPMNAWFLVVAAPTLDVSAWPKAEDLVAFRIPHGIIVKLHVGTWHAGPLGDWDDHMEFLNLVSACHVKWVIAVNFVFLRYHMTNLVFGVFFLNFVVLLFLLLCVLCIVCRNCRIPTSMITTHMHMRSLAAKRAMEPSKS